MSGTQFDGQVVEAFLEAVSTGAIIPDQRESILDASHAVRLAKSAG